MHPAVLARVTCRSFSREGESMGEHFGRRRRRGRSKGRNYRAQICRAFRSPNLVTLACERIPLRHLPPIGRQRTFEEGFNRAQSSSRLKVFAGQSGENTFYRFLCQARICLHDLWNRHSCGQRFKNQRDRNACASHPRASAEVFRISDNPGIHLAVTLLRPAARPLFSDQVW